MLNLYDLSRNELGHLLAEWGYGDYHAGRIWDYLYRQKVRSLEEMVELRPELRKRLAAETTLARLPTQLTIDSSDGLTRKFLLQLADGQEVETVLMRYPGRATACISTQAGCAMGCVFCATGQMGFVRHLTPGEIVAQVLHVVALLQEHSEELRNIVLMGMGEPLHNYDATMTAIDILTDDRGLAIGPRYITLSTVGLPPAIRRLADEERPVNLAVSLHAATDAGRAALVPINKRWPLGELIDACRYYVARRGRRIFFEWALIAGQNDTPEQAHALGRLLQGLEAHVNLIPLNPTDGYAGRPSDSAAVRHFQDILAEYGLPSTVRQRRGLDIAAGCGQLRAQKKNGR
ncbi:MAG: 23S rRNA (adenine(2503)-C(2))-methyltransferase RlmN [Chloroflexi bacterium]|nr:23S rRNA (adenine(2503)-C(2))-methyltransferase RlmN [Chloroflexota bacterium]MCI0580845.1 23S rRNA (adenine(2503)-C(2))-methyltransferase RlmN [Chloroflexota bacterium]MCI0648613.1 23S rRNA (adenine(2503)-C(2))-methyltransferase RlmN [Chloroflexota bacterium]MCI0730463.1 23S rRNA (adenine(2503)-C(2))-methyltransferase RlmN [Chloroflexota bacterium]